MWALATHPTHDRVMAGGALAARALWVLGADETRCAGDAPGELRAAQWIDDTRAVLAVEAHEMGGPAGPLTVIVRDLAGGAGDRVVASLPNAGFRTTLTVDRAGRRAVVNTNEAVHLVDLTGGSPPRVVERFDGDRAGLICGAISPDGTRVLAARGAAPGVRLYDADTGALVRRMAGAVRNGIVDACFDPTGQCVAALTLDAQRLVVWNLSDGSVRFTADGPSDLPPALAFSQDGARLAWSEHGHRVAILDARDGRVLAAGKSLDGYAFRLAFTRDDRALLVADDVEVHAIALEGAPPAIGAERLAAGAWRALLAGHGVSYLTGGCVDDDGALWVVGQSGRAFTSADEGVTWGAVKVGKRPYLHGACRARDGAMHLFGDGVILTSRGGAFDATKMPSRGNVVAMASTAQATVALSYQCLFVRAPHDDAWVRVSPEVLAEGWCHDIVVDARGTLWVASGSYDQGFVARADDPRGPWTSTAFDAPIWCVACDGDDVYACGERGAMWRGEGRGARWERLASPIDGAAWRALAARAGVVYAATELGEVCRSDDRGATWSLAHRGPAEELLITARGTVVAVGNGPLWGCVDATLARTPTRTR